MGDHSSDDDDDGDMEAFNVIDSGGNFDDDGDTDAIDLF